MPITTPAMIVSTVTDAPIASDSLLPKIVRENTSRPTLSVPKYASAEGAMSLFTGSSAFGSSVAISGANPAISTASSRIISPINMFGLRRNSS